MIIQIATVRCLDILFEKVSIADCNFKYLIQIRASSK